MDTEIIKKNNFNLKEFVETKNFVILKQGAEAKLYYGLFENKKVIAKERFSKKYRISELDRSLNKKRTKHEDKLLNKAILLGIHVPKVIKSDIESGIIMMEFIEDSITARDYFIDLVKSDKSQKENVEILSKISFDIGKIIGKFHSNQVIHGDLTTSNILIKNYKDSIIVLNYSLFFIDFGLSFISSQSEDKAVDLYVLERALLSTHSSQAKLMFEKILEGYQLEYNLKFDEVLERLNQVRLRGNLMITSILLNFYLRKHETNK
jgi:TP53 regulating kinase-like protein